MFDALKMSIVKLPLLTMANLW
eukprot:COSAG03_NODE_22276_length_293_cov_0.788660_1_plen_21_part_10